MKIMLLGITIILFSIAMILVSSGGAKSFSFDISIVGLIISIAGYFIRDRK